MALKEVANSNCTIEIQNVGGSTPDGVLVNTGIPSIKVLAEGAGVLKDGFTVLVSAITDNGLGATTPDPVSYVATFSATTTVAKADGTLVLRVDDETGIINAMPIVPAGPTSTPTSFKLVITDAGQTTVLSN